MAHGRSPTASTTALGRSIVKIVVSPEAAAVAATAAAATDCPAFRLGQTPASAVRQQPPSPEEEASIADAATTAPSAAAVAKPSATAATRNRQKPHSILNPALNKLVGALAPIEFVEPGGVFTISVPRRGVGE